MMFLRVIAFPFQVIITPEKFWVRWNGVERLFDVSEGFCQLAQSFGYSLVRSIVLWLWRVEGKLIWCQRWMHVVFQYFMLKSDVSSRGLLGVRFSP
jgi:hypothetical protein